MPQADNQEYQSGGTRSGSWSTWKMEIVSREYKICSLCNARRTTPRDRLSLEAACTVLFASHVAAFELHSCGCASPKRSKAHAVPRHGCKSEVHKATSLFYYVTPCRLIGNPFRVVAGRGQYGGSIVCVCVCVCCHPIYSGRQVCGRTSGVTQEEGHTGFLHLPSAVLALIFIARRIQPFLSLVDCDVEFCVQSFSTCWAFFFFFLRKSPGSFDETEVRTHVPTSEVFEVTN